MKPLALLALLLIAACDSHPCWPDGPPPQCTPVLHPIPYHPDVRCQEDVKDAAPARQETTRDQ